MLAFVCIGAVGARVQQPAAPPQALEPAPDLTPSEIETYQDAQTLIDWTPHQVHHCPFLHHLRVAGSQDELPMVLERVGQTVTLLFHDFPRIACDEVISETHPGPGTLDFATDYTPVIEPSDTTVRRKLRYIVVPRPAGDVPAFEEYRTDPSGNPLDALSLRGFVMGSANYTSTCLYLSPADQHNNRFRYFGIQTIRERECHVVGFAQEPGRARRVTRFDVQGKTAGLLFQGLSWIDSETFQILRIKTWLLAPRKDIGLSYQSSTVDFYPVHPSGFERVLWLPREVTVVTSYRGTQVRNTHRYSNFKLFRVESTIKGAE
jgi:hypothetical protein